MKIFLLGATSLLLLSGCGDVKYTDVSEKPPYSDSIGNHYEVVGPVYAYLIKGASKNSTPYIDVTAPPRLTGPEIGLEQEVAMGTILVVTGVERTNRLFECKTSFRLAPLGALNPKGQQYTIRLEGMLSNQGDRCGDLNPKYYRKIFP